MYKFLLLVCFFLTACGGGDAGSTPSGHSATVATNVPTTCTIELNGDSIMAGLSIDTFALSIAKKRKDFFIVDKAVAGLSMRSLWNGYVTPYPGGSTPSFGAQMPFQRVNRTSHVVLIELGGNDAYGDYPAEEFAFQLEGMIITLMKEGRIPVLTGIVPLTLGGAFDQATIDRSAVLDEIVHTLAAKYQLIDAQWRTVRYDGKIDTIDGIHRTQGAADRLVERTIEGLDAACKL